MIQCPRCALLISPGVCGPEPHVFHDRPIDCVMALVSHVDVLKKAHDAKITDLRTAAQDLILALCGDKSWNKETDDAVCALQATVNNTGASLSPSKER